MGVGTGCVSVVGARFACSGGPKHLDLQESPKKCPARILKGGYWGESRPEGFQPKP